MTLVNWDAHTPEQRVEMCGVPYPKVTVCSRPDYVIQYEQVGLHTFVHVTVLRWSTTSRRAFERDCDALQELIDGPVMVLCLDTDTKLRKFCTKFGFEPVLPVTTTDGQLATILRRNNKKKWASAADPPPAPTT